MLLKITGPMKPRGLRLELRPCTPVTDCIRRRWKARHASGLVLLVTASAANDRGLAARRLSSFDPL